MKAHSASRPRVVAILVAVLAWVAGWCLRGVLSERRPFDEAGGKAATARVHHGFSTQVSLSGSIGQGATNRGPSSAGSVENLHPTNQVLTALVQNRIVIEFGTNSVWPSEILEAAAVFLRGKGLPIDDWETRSRLIVWATTNKPAVEVYYYFGGLGQPLHYVEFDPDLKVSRWTTGIAHDRVDVSPGR